MSLDTPARIILIEDNPADVLILRDTLESYGQQYFVEVLPDGEKALRFIHEYCGLDNPSAPCVLVLDLNLPRYDGSQILRAIKREPALCTVRVVAITGSASPHLEAEIRSVGVRLYRTKPTDLDGYRELAEDIILVCNEHVLSASV
jgi:CheY-like chemotaxis protein